MVNVQDIDPDAVGEAFPAILNAMKTHIDDITSLRSACGIFMNLTHFAANKRRLLLSTCQR